MEEPRRLYAYLVLIVIALGIAYLMAYPERAETSLGGLLSFVGINL